MTTKKLITSRDPKGLHAVCIFETMYNKAKLVDGPDESGQRLNEHPQFAEKLFELILECSSLIPIDTEYLEFRDVILSVPSTSGPYKRENWQHLFPSGMENYSDSTWAEVAFNCPETKPLKIYVSDLIKDGNYSQLIKKKPYNFFHGIEQAFKIIENNLSLVVEVLKLDRRVHIPFMNATGNCFVANAFESYGQLRMAIYDFSDHNVLHNYQPNMILFPQR